MSRDDLRPYLEWVGNALELTPSLFTVEPVTGDASTRRYWRLRVPQGQTYMFCHTPPDSNDNDAFINVQQRLAEADIPVPDIYAYDESRGWMLMQDFGPTLLKDVLSVENGDPVIRSTFPVLSRLAFEVDCAGLPSFSDDMVQPELDMFTDWFLPRHVDAPLDGREQKVWDDLCRQLSAVIQEQPQVFAHRDFHSCNLIYREDQMPGLIDFQDGALGPVTYDLISLIWDRYIAWPRADVETWLLSFLDASPIDCDRERWLYWCDMTGLQRHLKVVGIFSRLSYRDGKMHYLDLLPQFADYALDVFNRYDELADARAVLAPRLNAGKERSAQR